MMHRVGAIGRTALLLAVGLSVVCLAGEGGAEHSSGLPVGKNTPAFNVRDVTGPYQGKKLCYI